LWSVPPASAASARARSAAIHAASTRSGSSGVAKGLIVAIVPTWTERTADGTERPGDPAVDLVYFATPELPERVDAAWIAAERARAEAALAGGTLHKAASREVVRHARLDAASQDALITRAAELLPDPSIR